MTATRERYVDLTILLTDNEAAYLRVPSPLTEEQFDYLMEQLEFMKRGLVEKFVEPASERGEITLELRRKLLALGYTPADIVGMSVSQAWEAVAGGKHA